MKSDSRTSALLTYQKFNLSLVRLCLGLKLEFPYFHGRGKLAYEPTHHKSVDYRAFRSQITTEGIIEIFAQ